MLLLGNILGAHSWVHILDACCLISFLEYDFSFLILFISICGLCFSKSLGTYCDLYWLFSLVVVHPKTQQKGHFDPPITKKSTNVWGIRISDKHWALSNNINHEEPYQFWFCNGMQIHGALFNWPPPPPNVNFEMGLGKSFKFNSQSC